MPPLKAGLNVADPTGIDWSRITALVISPGIPSTFPKPHPVAAAARAAGKPIICDVELLARAQDKARFVAITGTNGKSTTTALIGHILTEAGVRCEVGGNIGRGALDLAPLGEGGLYVLELSSYQLELLETFHAHVAVWLNITPDHIDRHGDLAGYVAAKENIFARQQVRDCAVIGVDDQPSRAVYAKLVKRGIAAVPVKLETAGRRRHLVSAPACWSMPTATRSISPTCRPCRATTTRRTPPAPGRPAAGSACRARGSSPA